MSSLATDLDVFTEIFFLKYLVSSNKLDWIILIDVNNNITYSFNKHDKTHDNTIMNHIVHEALSCACRVVSLCSAALLPATRI